MGIQLKGPFGGFFRRYMFGLVTCLLGYISYLIDIVFQEHKVSASAMNAAVAYNLEYAVTGLSPDFSIFSRSKLIGPGGIAEEALEGGQKIITMNDNDLEIFLRQLKQVIDWTAHLANRFEPNTGNYGTVFRNTNPVINGKEAFNIDGDYTTWNIDDCDINNYITLLEHTITERNKYSSEKKDNIILSGRILCFETFLSTLDGAAIIGSDLFFDESDVPPIDTWFYLEKVLNSNQRPILYCWIPSEFEGVVNGGIEVEILDSYSWLDKKDPVFYRKIMDKLEFKTV